MRKYKQIYHYIYPCKQQSKDKQSQSCDNDGPLLNSRIHQTILYLGLFNKTEVCFNKYSILLKFLRQIHS